MQRNKKRPKWFTLHCERQDSSSRLSQNAFTIFNFVKAFKVIKSPVKLTSYRTLAEREGFEPPVPLSTTVFKTAAIDHSAISPKLP